MKSVEFSATLAAYLGPRTNHFVHELINFARSPYNDLISYECNVQYRARQPEAVAGAGGEEKQLPLLPGLHCFKDFTMRVDEDECVDFFVDLDLEDDDADMIDEPRNLVELNAPLMFELRRMLNERQAVQSAQQMQQQQTQSQSNQSAAAVVGVTGAAGVVTATATVNGTTASPSGAMGLPAGVLSNDIGLDVAIERSILEGIDSGYFTQRRNTSFARQIANRNRDAAAAAATVAASAGGAATGGGGAAAAAGGGGTSAGAVVAQAANSGSVRPNMTGRQRTTNVAVKRRRTVIREI